MLTGVLSACPLPEHSLALDICAQTHTRTIKALAVLCTVCSGCCALLKHTTSASAACRSQQAGTCSWTSGGCGGPGGSSGGFPGGVPRGTPGRPTCLQNLLQALVTDHTGCEGGGQVGRYLGPPEPAAANCRVGPQFPAAAVTKNKLIGGWAETWASCIVQHAWFGLSASQHCWCRRLLQGLIS